MLQALNLNAAKLVIFAVSTIFGGVGYITADVIGMFSRAPEEVSTVGGVELSKTKFDGEFTLFAVTDNPVDLGFVKDSSIYFLSQTGNIVKSTFDEENNRQLSRYFDFESASFLAEAGCSAIAFHPDFSSEHTRGYGKFFVALAEKKGSGVTFEGVENEKHQEVIYEFTAKNHLSDKFEGTHREVIRLSSLGDVEGSVITDLTFDHRGLLYVGVCDSPNSETSKASDLESVYGKVLRIDPLYDVENDTAYRIPRSNPFYLVNNSLSELWSYGLRRPHTVSYDPFREWVCISDSGQDMLEEINVSHFGAEFFGWNLSEGSFFYPPSGKLLVGEEITSPQIEYARSAMVGRNVGGMIYRGERFPFLDGKAVFADDTGRLMAATLTPDQHTTKIHLLQPFSEIKGGVKSLKNGPDGEIFVFCEDGKIFELNKTRPMQRHQRYHYAMLAMIR
ncbi:MAG: PQQ-dependent sugar dehydrogenase [Verrucomicrobiales bacterium]|nr:PQQ-dependent sugar dehydrogenase [Verrucomicrobiales bacterium]